MTAVEAVVRAASAGRMMSDARELAVAQIGEVLGVSRTAIYRALSQDRAVETVPTAGSAVELQGPAPKLLDAPEAVKGAAAGRRRPSGSWFVVEADERDQAVPVAVMSRHASERAARTALLRERTKRPAERGAVLDLRPGERLGARLERDADLGRTVVREGPPRP